MVLCIWLILVLLGVPVLNDHLSFGINDDDHCMMIMMKVMIMIMIMVVIMIMIMIMAIAIIGMTIDCINIFISIIVSVSS